MRAQWNGPWLVCGDFNEVLSQDEHVGPRDRTEAQISAFRDCMQVCELKDLGFEGPKFTWSNRQDADTHVKVRLDRVVANGMFSSMFEQCTVENIITTSSDHYAILISLERGSCLGRERPVQHSFKYEAMWLRAPDYKEVLEKAWSEGNNGQRPLHATWSNLNRVAGSLKDWSRATFGSVRKEIRKLEGRLRYIRGQILSDATVEEEREVERQLCELFEREEIMARQRSRVEWLREGDRNTAFFHARASARRRTNKIDRLYSADGSICETQGEIKSMIHRFYEDLFSSEMCTSSESVLNAIPSKVTADMNDDLCKPYTEEEIRDALFQMGPTKAPGPDGFPALFYQTHWDFFKEEICEAVRSFINGGEVPEGFCDSVIVLIPKVTKARNLKNFRPISLCNVIYKIASKVLANRLKVILPHIISEHQSAFVPGRIITDNVLIAFECLHTVRHQDNKRPFFALKINMMKAYDRVEWDYLHGCLCKLGFAPAWIQSVMRCVTCVRYAVHVNGELTEPVVPSRGIRQGDPISPYLFLLCTEGLSSLLQQSENRGELHGVKNGRLGPAISHLLFADDSIFFARSDSRSVESLKNTLKTFCDGSGQKINLDKSSVFFGNHCQDHIKERVENTLGVQSEILNDFYLGMPTSVGRSPTVTFNFLLDMIWKRLNGVVDRPLSRAGKEVFLKSVIQAIPTYAMSCFQIPITNCDKMRSTIANEWWGMEEGKRKLHWRSWE
jgi:hypothetical protein